MREDIKKGKKSAASAKHRLCKWKRAVDPIHAFSLLWVLGTIALAAKTEGGVQEA